MIVYIASPYSNVKDKQQLMKDIASFCGKYMQENQGQYTITGLVHHYAVQEVSTLGSDWNFWKDFCEDFLSRCDTMIVLMFDGWKESRGVQEEIRIASERNIPCTFINPYTY